jgi:EAL and modified HD-GYP domain-containing signal transduction protein
MATQSLSARSPHNALSELASAMRYVARQPILDLRGKVHGYELLFRSGPEAVFRGNGELATQTMIDNTVIFGLERLTGGSPAFVNCTAEALSEEQVIALPPSMTVLEILETVEPSPRVINACRRLKTLGFRLALDDFVWKPELAPLLDLADYIKIDFLLSGTEERRDLLNWLGNLPVALVAEKVETEEEYKRARSEGFTLFQGYYFCRPTLLTNRKVPANRLFHIEMLRVLGETPLDLLKLTDLVKCDPSLTYRLLRLVNSPACAVRQEVRSIQTALIAVGDDVFRRIATLAIASELNAGQPAEILRMALVRARFCELASRLCALDSTEQYLLGMFSMLPAMLRTSMEEVLSSLPLRGEIRKALLGEQTSERCLLQWLESNENGDWLRCDGIALSCDLNPDCLQECLTEAIVWTEVTLPVSAAKANHQRAPGRE